MKELVLARHAESEFNVAMRLNGDPSVQVALTEAGCAQARALGAEAAPTVAVLACGVDVAYPRGNDRLLARAAQRGLVVSELPPGSSPTRARFLVRNRVIAALALGTVVVEAAARSGSLATADRARELGRHLMAVPGPVTSALSAGCHALLRDGATCVTRAEEVLDLVRRRRTWFELTAAYFREIGDELEAQDDEVLRYGVELMEWNATWFARLEERLSQG